MFVVDEQQALMIIDQMIARSPGTRADHQAAQQALQVVVAALNELTGVRQDRAAANGADHLGDSSESSLSGP